MQGGPYPVFLSWKCHTETLRAKEILALAGLPSKLIGDENREWNINEDEIALSCARGAFPETRIRVINVADSTALELYINSSNYSSQMSGN